MDHRSTPERRTLKSIGFVVLFVLILYPLSYTVGRITGFGGLVIDDTTSISFSRNGEVTAAMGGGFHPMKSAGWGGIFLGHLNALFKPIRALDHACSECKFYWFFYDPE